MASLGIIMFCVCKKLVPPHGDHRAEVGGPGCGSGCGAQGDAGAVTAEGPGRPEAGRAPPGGCHTLLVPSPRV